MNSNLVKILDFERKADGATPLNNGETPEICECGKPAKWVYMPARADENPYACDTCVPRGCSCNMQLKLGIEEIFDENDGIINPEEDYEKMVDEQGREYPCCEWWEINCE